MKSPTPVIASPCAILSHRFFKQTTMEQHMAQRPTMDRLLSRITIAPDMCHGKPCIRGLRSEFVENMICEGEGWDL